MGFRAATDEERQKDFVPVYEQNISEKLDDKEKETLLGKMADFLKGGAKGVISTATNLEQMGEKVFNPIVEKVTGQKIDTGNINQTLEEKSKASNTMQEIGKGAEQIAEFFTPVGLEAKVAKIPKAVALIKEAIKTGGISGIQEQDAEDAGIVGLTSLALGGVGAGATKALKPIKEILSEKVPGRILNSIIKPGVNDFKFGRNPGAAVVDEGITGKSITDLVKNITSKKREIGQQISDEVSKVKDRIDLKPAIAEIDKHMASATNQGEQALVSRLQSIRDGLTKTFTNVEGKLVETGQKAMDVSASEAWKIKQELGKAAKWTGQAFDSEANQARVDAYKKIALMLEEKHGATTGEKVLSKLNQRYGNMLTAEKAAQRRLDTLQRLNKVSFGDITTLGAGGLAGGLPGAIAAAGARRIVGSPMVQTNVAKLLSKLTPAEKSIIEKHLPKLQKIYLGSTNDEQQ